MQKSSEFDYFRLCRRFAILFDSCTDLLLISFVLNPGVFHFVVAKLKIFTWFLSFLHIFHKKKVMKYDERNSIFKEENPEFLLMDSE